MIGIYWIVLIILIAVVVFVFNMKGLKHKVFILFLVISALILYSGLMYISYKNDFDLFTFHGVFESLNFFGGWLGDGFENIKSLTANAIDIDWSF